MKNLKIALALLLAVALCLTLFAACAKTETPAKADEPAKTDTTPAKTDEPAKTDTPAKTDEPAPADEPDEIVDIVYWSFDDYGKGQDHHDRIQAAVNKITEPEGIHVDITYMSFGDWSTKVQMGLAGGDRCDVIALAITNNITNMRLNKMLRTDITDIWKEYAAEAMETVDYLMAPYIGADGTIYGLPAGRANVGTTFLILNGEVIDELGIGDQVAAMHSFSELEEVLKIVKEAYPDWYAITPYRKTLIPANYGGDSWDDFIVADGAGDSTGTCFNNNGKLELYQKRDSYYNSIKLAADWFNKGYVVPDGLYNDNQGDPDMKAKIAFANMPCGSEGTELTVSNNKTSFFEYKAVAKALYTNVLSTGNATTWGTGVPVTCEEPEAAVKFINMMYTRADLMNTLVHGEEGVDYDVVNGECVRRENSFANGNFISGNNLLTWPLQGNGADYWERIDQSDRSAPRSQYYGFVLDTSDLQLLISQISAVSDQYAQTLGCGGYTEELYQEYIAKLEAAGVYDYIDAVQAQIDAWVAAQ